MPHSPSYSSHDEQAAQPSGVSVTAPSLVSPANSLTVHFGPSSKSLMNTLNRTGHTGFFLAPSLFCSPKPFKDDRKWPINDFCKLPQHSWTHPIRVQAFMDVRFI